MLPKRDWSTKLRVSTILLFATIAILGPMLVMRSEGTQQNILTSKKAATPPTLDGTVDELWSQAMPLTVQLFNGANFPPDGSTTVTLRSVYSGDMVYFLVQWNDSTKSLRRSPWVKQKDGSWKTLKDPNDKGGDNNLYYEDKFAFLWNISSPAFERSVFSAGHIGDAGKPYGTMYTQDGGLLDMWHWKSVRSQPVGQIDDQYMDGTRYDAKNPNAGRKSDPGTGGYVDNITDDKAGPKFAPKGHATEALWILDSEKELIDSAKYEAGDEMPSIIVAPFAGDRADISSGARWENGVWTLEISRKLVTGSKFDIQFNDMKKTYAFGVAAFDNAAVRHAFSPTVLWFRFQ